MNEQVRNILEQSTTKTSKIEQLLRLGLTRREIADLVTRGNYGFVYNVEKKMQEEIAQLEVTGESGAGLVKVTINGAHNCRRVEIDPSLLEDDKEMLEDLVAAAFNDAARRIEETQKEKMASVSSGMQLPPGFKMPF